VAGTPERTRGRLRSAALASVACAACLLALVLAADAATAAGSAQAAKAHAKSHKKAHKKGHFACSGPLSAKVPCYFSTPRGNIRCLWTPRPSNVACEIVRSGRAYRLRPTGKARAIKLKLARRGETLPTNQQIVFPQSLSCHDTSTTMTCNQDFGTGFFKLSPRASRSG
jgi:hypothetical protein